MAAKTFLGNTAGIVNTCRSIFSRLDRTLQLRCGTLDGTSVALGTIGWRMYLIWMSFGASLSLFNGIAVEMEGFFPLPDVLESILWYLFAIETAGRTLEDEYSRVSIFCNHLMLTFIRFSTARRVFLGTRSGQSIISKEENYAKI
jgi:hypothetical protein